MGDIFSTMAVSTAPFLRGRGAAVMSDGERGEKASTT